MANWLNIIPTIPLTRGVPVRTRHHRLFGVCVSSTDDGYIIADRYSMDQSPQAGRPWRVDLDDPQGFAYALRWLHQNSAEDVEDFYSEHDLTLGGRYLRDETTDDDRLTVAEDLAVIVAGR